MISSVFIALALFCMASIGSADRRIHKSRLQLRFLEEVSCQCEDVSCSVVGEDGNVDEEREESYCFSQCCKCHCNDYSQDDCNTYCNNNDVSYVCGDACCSCQGDREGGGSGESGDHSAFSYSSGAVKGSRGISSKSQMLQDTKGKGKRAPGPPHPDYADRDNNSSGSMSETYGENDYGYTANTTMTENENDKEENTAEVSEDEDEFVCSCDFWDSDQCDNFSNGGFRLTEEQFNCAARCCRVEVQEENVDEEVESESLIEYKRQSTVEADSHQVEVSVSSEANRNGSVSSSQQPEEVGLKWLLLSAGAVGVGALMAAVMSSRKVRFLKGCLGMLVSKSINAYRSSLTDLNDVLYFSEKRTPKHRGKVSSLAWICQQAKTAVLSFLSFCKSPSKRLNIQTH
jgi:hypothetical protein